MSSLYPGSIQMPPMKYCGNPKQEIVDKVMTSNDWAMQEKFDGALYMLEKTDDGKNIYLFSRSVSKLTGELSEKSANVPHIVEWAEKYLPNGTTLVGEIYIPGGKSNDVTKIMGCLPEKAVARQEKDGYVKYYVFDCIRYRGLDFCNEPFVERYNILEYSFSDIWNKDINYIPAYTLDKDENFGYRCETFNGENWEQDGTFQFKLNEIFARGGEGAVFKKKDSIYRPSKRTTASQSFKMKEHIDSLDLVVMELLDPVKEYTGKELDSWEYFIDGEPVTKPYYYGWKNALKVGAYDKNGKLVEVGRVASGLDDTLRADLANNSDNYIGSVVELSCMSVNKKDLTIRHPVFVRFRNDKNAEDCKIEEIFS